jgi:hypothetical protein
MAEAHDSPKFLGGWVVCMQWPLVVMAQTKTPRHKQKLHGTNKNSTAQTKASRHKVTNKNFTAETKYCHDTNKNTTAGGHNQCNLLLTC